jgi:hypothetical protein
MSACLPSIDQTGEQREEEGERRRQPIHSESVPEALPRFKDLLSWASIGPSLRRRKPLSVCLDQPMIE